MEPTGVKIRCPRCRCFIILQTSPDTVLVPEVLPVPLNKCDLVPPCTCHTGIGLMPRFEVLILNESAESHAKKYKHITFATERDIYGG